MDLHLEQLLRSILGAEPGLHIYDEHRKALVHSLLGLNSREQFLAMWKFTQSISDELTRSEVMNLLARRISEGSEFALAEEVARSIPDPYWRLTALVSVAAGQLKQKPQIEDEKSNWRETALRLFRQVHESLPAVSEEYGDRTAVIWALGTTLVDAGELDWAETVANANEYSPERIEVLMRVARAKAGKGDTIHALRIARTISHLANCAIEPFINRAFDLAEAGKLIAEFGDRFEARKCLLAAAELALASQEGTDVDSAKCLGLIAVALADTGAFEAAKETANKIKVPARREETLLRITNIYESNAANNKA